MRISDWSSDVCSSDLIRWFMRYSAWKNCRVASGPCSTAVRTSPPAQKPRPSPWSTITASTAGSVRHSSRSEEHTSELQSLMRISYAVFCLKKKKTTQSKQHNHIDQYSNTKTVY